MSEWLRKAAPSSQVFVRYLGGASRVHLRVAGAATDKGGGLSKALPPTPTPPPNKAIMITTNKKKKQNSK